MSRKSLFFLCLAVAAAILLYKWSGLGFDWSLFFSSLWNVQPIWLAASIVATLMTYVVRAVRWQALLSPVKSVRMGVLISTNVLGFSAIYLIGRAGEVVRPVWLTRQEQIPLTSSVATIIVERFLDTLMVVALFGWALLVVKVPPTAGSVVAVMKPKAWILVGGSVAALIVLFFFRANIESILQSDVMSQNIRLWMKQSLSQFLHRESGRLQ